MAKVTIDDFTNKELINAIADWLDSINLRELADDVRLGSWLDPINERLKNES